MSDSKSDTSDIRSPDDLLRLVDVAKEYGIGRDTVARLIKNREIRYVPDGEKKLIRRREIDAWVERTTLLREIDSQ
jgi:excisionase family DNA binding protein